MAHIQDIKPMGTEIELGGKVRTLKYDLNAYAVLEDKFGSVQKAMEAMMTGSIKSIKYILWVGLIHEEVKERDEDGEPTAYNITPYVVGSWINPGDLESVTEKLGRAINGDMPAKENLPDATKKAIDNLSIVEPTDPKMAVVILTPEEKAELDEKNV